MNQFLKSCVASSCVALLCACGGGGGGASSSNASFPVESVFASVATGGASFTGSATDGADTWTAAISTVAAADRLFEGSTVKASDVSLTIKKNGVTALSSSGQNLFTINPYTPKGVTLADGSYGVQTVAASALPSSGTVGASGSLGKVTLYRDSTKAVVSFTQEATWTLEADTASTAFLCTNTTAKDTSGQIISTTAGCYKVDTTGSLRGMRWTLAVAGKTLTFQ